MQTDAGKSVHAYNRTPRSEYSFSIIVRAKVPGCERGERRECTAKRDCNRGGRVPNERVSECEMENPIVVSRNVVA
jgi:hypothetical protein